MTVWCVHPINDKGVNIQGATAYGPLKFINGRYIYIDELSDGNIPFEFRNKMLKAVDQFEPDHDYLLIAGDHLQLIIMSALLYERWGSFQVLRYDRKAGGYAEANVITER